MDLKKTKNSEYKLGVICVLFCQLWWGLCPIFWEALKPIDAKVIIVYRIFTMFVFSIAAARMKYSWKAIFSPLRDRKTRIKYFTAGIILATNWSIYVWAMVSERVIQSTIGYYIEPLVICLFGVVIFGEKMTKYNIVAMSFAAIAVVIILLHYGQLPGTALSLAGTWAVYSAIKKTSELPVLISLVYETMILGILAIIVILYMETHGIGGLSYNEPVKFGMLFLTGLITVIPIGLFGVCATKIPLYLIGLFQYVSPTITLLCGIFLFKEGVDKTQIIAFSIIWIGLIIFSIGEFKNREKN